MAERMTLEIVTPERVLLRDEAMHVRAQGVTGSLGILPNHSPLLTELAPGELRYRRPDGRESRYAVGGGFLQIFNNEVRVLADSAERPEEIDLDRARRALDQARSDLHLALESSDIGIRREAELALKRAQNRIDVAGGA